MKKDSLTVRPIGWVVKGRPWPPGNDRWEEAEAEIEIDPTWAGALDGIERFSHIWVVWWLDRSEGPPDCRANWQFALHVHPERRAEMPLVGVLATRSPQRPNPIAITAVRLLERQGARLRVAGHAGARHQALSAPGRPDPRGHSARLAGTAVAHSR